MRSDRRTGAIESESPPSTELWKHLTRRRNRPGSDRIRAIVGHMEVSRSEVLSATSSEVWDALVDVERWPLAMYHIRAVRRLDGGPFGLGSSAELEQPGLPSAAWTVDRFKPGVGFRWRGRPLGIAWSADHQLEPAGDSATRLTLSVTASGWRAALLGPLLRTATRRALRSEMSGFRSLCRGGP